MVKKVSIWSILEPLLYSREPLYLRELSKILKKPHPTLIKQFQFFEKLGVVTKTKKGRLSLYRLNYENPLLVDVVSVVEKEKVVRKCREEPLLREVVDFIHKNLKNDKVIIFGSFTENSKKANDIDVLVLGRMKNYDKLRKFERKINLKFHIIEVRSLDEISGPLRNEIMKKHLTIRGVEFWVSWMLEN